MKPTPEQERIARAVVKISYLEAESEHGSVVSELYIKIAQALAVEAEKARRDVLEEVDEVLDDLIAIAKSHAMQTYDRHGSTRKVIDRAEAIRRRGQDERR